MDNTSVDLVIVNRDELAAKITDLYTTWQNGRTEALSLTDEIRMYVYGTSTKDILPATANPHTNKTMIPKLSEIHNTLISEYWDAALGIEDFFTFEGDRPQDEVVARLVTKWVMSKLSRKKFRAEVGRKLLDDYVIAGNCFLGVDYKTEVDYKGDISFKGAVFYPISYLDIVFDPAAASFNKTAKIIRRRMSVDTLRQLPESDTTSEYDKDAIAAALEMHSGVSADLYAEKLQEMNIQFDGYDVESHVRSNEVEVLIYRGDIYNSETEELEKNRIIYVVDRMFVVRNSPWIGPEGMSGIYHAAWKTRTGNLWGQGPLDNIVGMQYRINHLENLKADIFDFIAKPVVKYKGNPTLSSPGGLTPGAEIYLEGEGDDVTYLHPDTTALNADTQIEVYMNRMERIAGVPPEARGVRSPGEKTAFEVNILDNNSTKLFKDKTAVFENMLEGALLEAFHLMLLNFDGEDYVRTFDDLEGAEILKQIALEDVQASGTFKAIGSRHWERRNKMVQELRDFQLGPAQDPKIRAHLDGWEYAQMYMSKLGWSDTGIFKQYAGVKEDVAIQAVSQAEMQEVANQTQAGQPGQGNPGQGGGPLPQ